MEVVVEEEGRRRREVGKQQHTLGCDTNFPGLGC